MEDHFNEKVVRDRVRHFQNIHLNADRSERRLLCVEYVGYPNGD